jgi:DNA primase
MLQNIINSCRYLLNNYPAAQPVLEYLNTRLNSDSQEKFQFGYFPGPEDLVALTSLVSEEDLIDYKLLFTRTITDSLYPRIIKSGYFDDYPLIMPIKDLYGNPIALVGRTIIDEEVRKEKKISKYKYTMDFTKTNNVFGLYENKNSIIQNDLVYVVEGQIDVIKAMERNFNNIVGIGGSSMSSYQFSLITRYTDNIFLLLDNDDAGEKGRKNIIERFGKYANISNLYLPDAYKDIDEYFRANPADEIELIYKQ